jgi:hypothetical protein
MTTAYVAQNAVLSQAKAEAMEKASELGKNVDLTFNVTGTRQFLEGKEVTEDVADTSVARDVQGTTSAAPEVAGGTTVLAFVVTPPHDDTEMSSPMHEILGTANLQHYVLAPAPTEAKRCWQIAASNLYVSLIT